MENIIPKLRAIYRVVFFALLIIAFLLLGLWIHLTTRNESARLKKFSQSVHFFCKFIVKYFGIHVTVLNPPKSQEPFLMISNHMGFIDILANGSISPLLFVTSKEMKDTPGLGLITEMGGCLYVDRKSRAKILDELYAIAEVMKKGARIVLYPEATSTNGEQVLPFKKTLMMAAAYAGVPLQPVVVNFRKVNGGPFTLKWRDHLCWYGDIPFHTSLWKAFQLKDVDVEIEFLDPIYPKPEDDRSLIAEQAHKAISEKFTPVKAE